MNSFAIAYETARDWTMGTRTPRESIRAHMLATIQPSGAHTCNYAHVRSGGWLFRAGSVFRVQECVTPTRVR